MKKIIILFIIAFAINFNLFSQSPPTWSADVANILYKNCTSCHHAGSIAPFELMTYSSGKKYAFSIKSDVLNNIMPPWPPDYNFQRYAHERILTQTEISTIVDWVNGGMISGDTTTVTAPVYSSNWLIQTPDLSVKIPTYTSTANTSDVYRCFVIPTGVSANKYIQEMEVIPGNGSIVHHVLVFSDNGTTCTSLDNADPLPGYTNAGGTGDANSKLIGTWVPGQGKIELPNGFGLKLPANAKIVLQIHYPAGSSGAEDSTRINFKYSTTTTPREVFVNNPLDNFSSSLKDGPLYIPANGTKTFHEQYTVPTNLTFFTTQPHMHLIGKQIKSYGVTPLNDTINFIKIDDWNFHWQGQYTFQHAMKVPTGTVLYAEAFYDNTTANADNPSSPPQNVFAGENTTDEMMMVFFNYTYYQTGDENIVLDPNFTAGVEDISQQNNSIKIYPNPTHKELTIENENLKIESINIYNVLGELVYNSAVQQLNNSTINIDVRNFKDGIYFITILEENKIFNQKFIKQ